MIRREEQEINGWLMFASFPLSIVEMKPKPLIELVILLYTYLPLISLNYTAVDMRCYHLYFAVCLEAVISIHINGIVILLER